MTAKGNWIVPATAEGIPVPATAEGIPVPAIAEGNPVPALTATAIPVPTLTATVERNRIENPLTPADVAIAAQGN